MSKESTKRELDLEDTIYRNLYDLNQALMALDSITDKYEWDYEPDARKASEYGGTVNSDKFCDAEAKRSWEYVVGYKTIMFLVNVARDYCRNISDECEQAIGSDAGK